MIHQPTLDQIRRVKRSRAYSGPGFGPRSFKCLGIGLDGLGFAFGGSSSETTAASVARILGGMTVPWVLDANGAGNTVAGGTIGTVKDQTGNGYDFVFIGAAPLYVTSGGPKGGAFFSTELAAGRCLRNTAYAAPTAGTTPLFVYGIVRINTWSTGALWAAKSGTGLPNVQGSTSGKFTSSNGVTSAEVAVTAGTWVRTYSVFNNSASFDKLRIGANDTGVGTSLGNTTSGAGFFIGINNTVLDASYSLMFVAHGIPSGAQITALDAALAGGSII